MSSTGLDAFERAQQRTNIWLATVAEEFDTSDRRFALRALRAWMHALRDRLTVPAAVKFAAQLPELLRGIYYDGWNPTNVPVKYGRDEFISRFALEARVRAAEVPRASAAVAAALRRHMSGEQVDEVLAELPRDLRNLIGGTEQPREVAAPAAAPAAAATPPAGRTPAAADGAERLDRLEQRLGTLTDAMEILARGMSDGMSGAEPDPERGAKSARLAAEILLAARA